MPSSASTVGPPMIGPRQVAELFNVSPATIFSWIKSGYLPPPIRVTARTVRWPRDKILALIGGDRR